MIVMIMTLTLFRVATVEESQRIFAMQKELIWTALAGTITIPHSPPGHGPLISACFLSSNEQTHPAAFKTRGNIF